ncbi:MAG: metallophosphoesterase [Clostridia bacterium]|nr:metallophosphoesterase [Clostridia bacterium]
MKLRKILSLTIIAAMIIATIAVISVPAVFAETVNTDTEYSEDFEGFGGNVNYQNTLLTLKDYGWYMADHDSLHTTVEAVAPYSTFNYKLAKIAEKDGSQCLQVVSAGEGSTSNNQSVPSYGYGKTFPGVAPGEAATGSWEISFDFKPALINNKTQFSFTLNTGDGSASSTTVAQHNIISGFNQRFYLGYRDHTKLLNNNVKQGSLKAADIGGLIWYTVKTYLNCEARYYSVELYNRATGELIARRSPISFDSGESIGFFKVSALGYNQESYLYFDNLSIKKTSRDTTIYNETFDNFTDASYVAEEGITTLDVSEDLKGTSYFKGYTPWRYHSDIGNSYAFEEDSELSSRVVRLGDKPDTTDVTEASGLVYMQCNEPLVTATTQPLRGIFKTSFKIKPETVVDPVSVNITPAIGIDIKDDNCAFFKIINDEGTPKLVKGSDYIDLDSTKWYDVQMSFDVLERTVTTVIKDLDGTTVAGGMLTGNSTPYAVRGLMFKADGGSSVLMDDIKLEYYTAAPSIDTDKIELTDRFGEKVTDLENVTTALKTIEIPMGCVIDGDTANTQAILLKDSSENTVPYTASISGLSYIMELDSALGLNEEYTLLIPGTVANASGVALGEDVTLTFKTVNDIVAISAISVDEEPVGSISDISVGSTMNLTLSYANGMDEAIDAIAFLAFYNGNMIVDAEATDFTIPASSAGTDEQSTAFNIPSDLDIGTVDKMSVFLWSKSSELNPLAHCLIINRKSGEAGKFKKYVDYEVNIESGRDAKILQITDPQIIDATQVREDVAFSQQKRDFWQPSMMNVRLFNDLRKVITEVNPDLILMTGDLVYGGYDDAGTSFTRLADFMDSFGIPWAPVFGNHDNESQKGADWQCDYLEGCDNCLFKQRTLTGNGNYSIGIVQDGELKRVIFMLDSNGCSVMSDETFANGHSKKTAGFGDDQIEWYTNAAEKINGDFDGMKYTFAFHIQPAAFEDALYNTYGFVNGGDVDENKNLVSPLNIDEREDKQPTDFGYIGRPLKGAWDTDRSVFNGMKALGADSILVGHEHCNSASVVDDGVRFQYGQKIGEYDRINFRTEEGKIVGYIAIETSIGTPILGGTVMELSQSTGEISNAYIHYCSK